MAAGRRPPPPLINVRTFFLAWQRLGWARQYNLSPRQTEEHRCEKSLTMPPPTRVCVRCKSTKSKCVNFNPGQWPDGPIARKCDRCARLGFDCVPAPSAVPKPRAPRKAKAAAGGGLLLNIAPSPLVTRALQQIPGTTTSSATETLSYVLSPGASPLAARRAPPRDGRMPVAAMPTALLWGD